MKESVNLHEEYERLLAKASETTGKVQAVYKELAEKVKNMLR